MRSISKFSTVPCKLRHLILGLVMTGMTRPKARCCSLRDTVENLEIERIKFHLAEIKELLHCAASGNWRRKNQQ